jgi:predicted GNAT superfamily acetyltransferase
MREFQACVHLQKTVWGFPDRDVVPPSQLLTASLCGGAVIGAIHDHRLVGFVWSQVGIAAGKPYLHSRMLGVLRAYRGLGIARRLKLLQREAALAGGIERIQWTFDPLERANAHLNLRTLGAVARVYHSDFYGRSAAALHSGLPTDRLVADWELRSPRVLSAVRRTPPRDHMGPLDGVLATRTAGAAAAPRLEAVAPGLGGPRVLVEVPPGAQRMRIRRKADALRWRLGLRGLFLAYFAAGYEARDLWLVPGRRGGARGYYVLERTAS